MPADMASWLLCKKQLNTKLAIVLTDFDINPLWLCHHYSLYFVAIEELENTFCAWVIGLIGVDGRHSD